MRELGLPSTVVEGDCRFLLGRLFEVNVSGKTGTLPFIRNEVGMVEYRDGGRYAVAVFTVAGVPNLSLPAADAVIGTAARIAVDALRSAG